MAPEYEATIVRELADVRRARPRLQGEEVGALVHLLPHGARRGRGRVRRGPRQPVDRRALTRCARTRRRASACPRPAAWTRSSGPRRPGRCPRTWRSPSIPTPSTASTRSTARRTCPRAREGARGAGAGALEREGRQRREARPPSPSTRAPRSRAPRFRHPWLDRELARRARRLRHARHRHRRRAHGARPRLGRLPDGRALRPRHLLPGRRGRPLHARGRALRGPEGLRRRTRRSIELLQRAAARCCRPGTRSTRTRSAGAARTRSSSAPRRSGSSRSTGRRTCAGRRSPRSTTNVQWHPAWGRDRIHDMIASRPDWCISRQRAVGRAHPGVLLRGLRRGRCSTPDAAAPRGRRLRDARAPTPGTTATAAALLPPGFALPEVRRHARSARRRTSSTSGSTRARRTRRCSSGGRTCTGRPTSTSRAATSTAAGSTRRC